MVDRMSAIPLLFPRSGVLYKKFHPRGVFFKANYLHLNLYIMSRLGNYLRDTAAEMKHVSWPTQTQAFIYTALVIGVSALVALFLGAFDYVFTTMLKFVA